MKPIQAAEILIEKIQRDYADDVSLVVIMGSTIYGETHSRSDLDMYYVPKTERGYNLSFTCIIDGIGYDFWGLSWERLERIANHDEKITSIITEGKVLYYGSDDDRERFDALKRRALDTGDRAKFLGRARLKLNDVYRDYANLLTAHTLSNARYAAVGVLYKITESLALLNRIPVKRGRGKLKGEILAMPMVPEDFETLYDTVFFSSDIGAIREACGRLIGNTAKLMRNDTQGPCDIAETLKGFYEELINSYNKIDHAAEIGDVHTALFAGVELRYEIEQAFDGTGVSLASLPDLLAAYSPDHLQEYAAAARRHQQQFEELLAAHGVKLCKLRDFFELKEYIDKL